MNTGTGKLCCGFMVSDRKITIVNLFDSHYYSGQLRTQTVALMALHSDVNSQ